MSDITDTISGSTSYDPPPITSSPVSKSSGNDMFEGMKMSSKSGSDDAPPQPSPLEEIGDDCNTSDDGVAVVEANGTGSGNTELDKEPSTIDARRESPVTVDSCESEEEEPITEATSAPPASLSPLCSDEEEKEIPERKDDEKMAVVSSSISSQTVPHAATAIRLLEKFVLKSSKMAPFSSLASSGSRSIFSYLFSPPGYDEGLNDPNLQVYTSLHACMKSSTEEESKALESITRFVLLLSTWSDGSAEHTIAASANSGTSPGNGKPKVKISQHVLSLTIDTAQSLTAHGCLDNLSIVTSTGNESLTLKIAVHVLVESLFLLDLSSEQTELACLKFLLTTGCRLQGHDQAMIRGTHLLQTIRVCYHIYLKTGSNPNKTTARAALQQLVSSVFKRMEFGPTTSASLSKKEFPSENHRDAFLVLRSLCKISMKSLPTGKTKEYRNQMWDEKTLAEKSQGEEEEITANVSTGMIMEESIPLSLNPALESKILALELLLYVLTHSSARTLLNAGPQFQFAIRHYLCVSLLNNCTSSLTQIVSLSLRLFVPLIQHFSSNLKTEIEAFVTNVFFVILDSPNSTDEHKSLVVTLFEQICSSPQTLAKIFLNYDCDMSAVDLFDRIVNALAKVSKIENDSNKVGSIFVAGTGASRLAHDKKKGRELRLDAMMALVQILRSLNVSAVSVLVDPSNRPKQQEPLPKSMSQEFETEHPDSSPPPQKEEPDEKNADTPPSLVAIYDNKKKLREEFVDILLRFKQSPTAGIRYAGACGQVDTKDPLNVARFFHQHKDKLEKTQIGEYLGREPDYQDGFCLRVLHAYVEMLDFEGLGFDDAIKHYLAGFRLPGEAQKIDRIMEKFAERYCVQNPEIFPTADAAFILAFSIIMLNTDLHNPAIKEDRRMTKEGFIRNNRGICDGKDLPAEILNDIFDRIKASPISLKEDDKAREAMSTNSSAHGKPSPAVFLGSHYEEMDKAREAEFWKERDQIVKSTESLFKRKRKTKTPSVNNTSTTTSRSKFVTVDSLRDEYVTPMFEVTWGPCLAVFSMAIESSNGTASRSALAEILAEEELEWMEENAASSLEVCLGGFQLAICTAGLCGMDVARASYVHALYNFTQLGTGRLMNDARHVRCIQELLMLGRDHGELLGNTWEHIFRALSEVTRLRTVYEESVRGENIASRVNHDLDANENGSHASSEFSDLDLYDDINEEEMGPRAIDESNAKHVCSAIPESLVDDIYQRSTSLSSQAAKEFIFQLCRVSRMEISGYGGHVGSRANTVDLTLVHYRQQHTLLNSNDEHNPHNQPIISSLQRLVEVTHYNMDSRPRLVFANMWSNVAGHLTSTALHANAAVAMYAVDSFRQLSIQFLTREELGMFEFQRKFLRPFEVVMARSEYVSTKELLLKCVEQIILMFGMTEPEKEEEQGGKRTRRNKMEQKKVKKRRGALRSGWRPVLAVLGLSGRDPSEAISGLGWKILNDLVAQSLPFDNANDADDTYPKTQVSKTLLEEYFVDLVDAVVMYIGGNVQSRSLTSIDHLIKLANWLADETIPLPSLRRRTLQSGEHMPSETGNHGDSSKGTTRSSAELGLWWPILLGLSRGIGDQRKAVREKSLETLLNLIGEHFFPTKIKNKPNGSELQSEDEVKELDSSSTGADLQTLQLIFRGVLTSTLEFAETTELNANETAALPSLPDDFAHFITYPPPRSRSSVTSMKEYFVNDEDLSGGTSWLDTTYGMLMDACVSICVRSMVEYKSDALIEEVLAMLNTCLLSDSGALAVRGLRRLNQFLTEDLPPDQITSDTWTVVCHMLRRCLTVRGLSSVLSAVDRVSAEPAANQGEENEDMALINDFFMEEEFLAGRRYICSNATMVIGKLLCEEKSAEKLGVQWLMVLISGLGKSINEWEQAANIIGSSGSFEGGKENGPVVATAKPGPPHYLENALYGRKWMVTLILLLASKEKVDGEEKDANTSVTQKLLKEQTQAVLDSFIAKEVALGQDGAPLAIHTSNPISEECRAGELGHITNLVCDLLEGYDNFDNEHLRCFSSWLCPMLSELIQSNNRAVRAEVHNLVRRMFEGPLSEKPNGETLLEKTEGETLSEKAEDETLSEKPNGETLSETPEGETLSEKPKGEMLDT